MFFAMTISTFKYRATNARAAAPLLTSNTYGVQYSQNNLRDYVVREMNMIYKQSAAYWSSEESTIPEGFMYSLRSNMGGVRRQHMNVRL